MISLKKLSAITASTLMAGMTLGLAAAASAPNTFVPGGAANAAVVYGANSADTDQVEAGNIKTKLATYVSSSGGDTTIEGESVQLKLGSDNFNLGDYADNFTTIIDVDDFANVLKDEVYYNDANNDFEYEQKLTLAGNMQMTHFRDRNYEDYEPTVGVQLAKNDLILDYSLEFTPNAAEGGTDFDDLESTFIKILGKEYFISAVNDLGTQITLLDSAVTRSIEAGETEVIEIDGESYEVSIKAISSDGVIFDVNGQDTNRLATGDSQKLAGGTVHIGVTDQQSASFAGDTSFATFSLGTGEIVIGDNVEVEINGDAISQIDEYDGFKLVGMIANTPAEEIDSVNLAWYADDDMFLTAESELVMPGFEAIKFTMSDLIVPGEEKTTFGTGDPFSVTTSVKDGSLSLDLFYLNSAEDAFGSNLGASSAQHLITNSTGGSDSTVSLNLANETYFVASWISGREAETYAYELSNIKDNSGKNETTLVNLAGGSNVVFKDTEDTKTVGRIKMTLTAANEEDETATIKVEPISSGSVYTDRVYTAEGLQFKLPYLSNYSVGDNPVSAANCTTSLADGEFRIGVYNTTDFVSFDCTPSSWNMNFTEEDVDGNIESGSSFQVTISVDADDGVEANGLAGATAQQIGRTGDDYIAYVQSDLATRIDWSKDTSGLDAMEVTYHGNEAYADVYIAEADATVSSGGATDIMIVTDSQVSSVSSKKLIVVGGSCINSVAADLIGDAYCGDSFESATGIGAGEFLIKGYSNGINGNFALLVAGYAAADTRAASQYLRENIDSLDVAKGWTGETVNMQVTEVTSA